MDHEETNVRKIMQTPVNYDLLCKNIDRQYAQAKYSPPVINNDFVFVGIF